MQALTGVLALFLIFLSGTYRNLQKRWRPTWGPVISIWAHSNITLAALAAVFFRFTMTCFPANGADSLGT